MLQTASLPAQQLIAPLPAYVLGTGARMSSALRRSWYWKCAYPFDQPVYWNDSSTGRSCFLCRARKYLIKVLRL